MSAFSLKQLLGSYISVNSLFCIYGKYKYIFLSFLITPKRPSYTCNSLPYIHILLLNKKSWKTFLIITQSCFPPFIYHRRDIVIHFMNVPQFSYRWAFCIIPIPSIEQYLLYLFTMSPLFLIPICTQAYFCHLDCLYMSHTTMLISETLRYILIW